ncbi:ankyrin repeat-containing domain protein [Tricladium varicosporioides]|nr:ankyrin repeat-containing domain protein [Hymenoscyphus varicosporioides]
MKDLLSTIRGQQSALQLLLAAVHTDSISDVRRLLEDNNTVMQNMVQRSMTLRKKRAASTIGGQDTEFDFDDQVVSSAAYRRVFRSFTKRDDSVRKQSEQEQNLHFGEDQTLVEGRSGSEAVVESAKVLRDHIESPPQPHASTSKQEQSLPYTPTSQHSTSRELDMKSIAASLPTSDATKALLVHSPQPSVEATPHQNQTTATPQIEGQEGQKGPDSALLLRTAAKNGHTSIVMMLLSKVSDINSTDASGETALMLAAQNGHIDVVKVLIQASANIHLRNIHGNAAINLACMTCGKASVVHCLMQAGADKEAVGACGWHPLHHAAGNDQPELVEILYRDYGANIESLCSAGGHPLHAAAYYGTTKGVGKLIELGADISALDNAGDQPLARAALQGHVGTMNALLSGGAKVNAIGKKGAQPIHEAAVGGSQGAAQLLIDSGADIEATNDAGDTPLIEAIRNGHEPMVRLLLKAGANIEGAGWSGWHPLHHAASNGKTGILHLLISHGADKSSKANNGDQPLHVAAMHGQSANLKILLDSGVNRGVLNNDGWSALQYAVDKGHLSVVEMLV